MEITALEPWKGTFYKVYVDGEYFAVLDAEVLLSEHLHRGTQVDGERLEEIRYASELRRARERAFHLLEYRSHSRKELMDKLLRNYDREICEEICDKMEEIGLVDDDDYVRQLAQSLVHSKHYGVTRLKQELSRRGIDRELTEEVIDEMEWDPQEELEALIERKYLKMCTDEKGVRRATNALIRLGYSYSQIRDALRDLLDKEDWEEE